MHMFEDQAFDIIFSNSVIEHVGSIQNQRKFADEVKRVGKSYWIQTPNRMFPIEPHFLFPFFQFLPGGLRKIIAKTWKYSHYKQWGANNTFILEELSDIRLLSRRELMSLFDAGSLYEEKYVFLTKSLVIYKNSKKKQPKESFFQKRRDCLKSMNLFIGRKWLLQGTPFNCKYRPIRNMLRPL